MLWPSTFDRQLLNSLPDGRVGLGGSRLRMISPPLVGRRSLKKSALSLPQSALQLGFALVRPVDSGVSGWSGAPLGYLARPVPEVTQGQAPSSSVSVLAGVDATMVLGPIVGPNRITSILLQATSVTLGSVSTSYRVWLSQTSVGDSGPQPSDQELTLGAVTVQFNQATVSFPVGAFIDFTLPQLFVKVRIGADVAVATRWTLICLVGGNPLQIPPHMVANPALPFGGQVGSGFSGLP